MAGILSVIAIVLFLLCWFLIIKKFAENKYSKVRILNAKITDKYKSNTVSHYPGTYNRVNYTVVFEADGKKLSFSVSEFSYNNYKVNKKGTLKYQGNKIISFK